MRARQDGLALFLSSQQVGCGRESLEVFRVKGAVTVGRFKQSVRFAPRPLLD